MNISTEFEIDQKVKILPFDINGIIESIYVYDCCGHYTYYVAYWNNMEKQYAYLRPEKIQAL